MRGWLTAAALLALALSGVPLAGAHEEEHGLHVTDVHFVYRVPSLQQEVRFFVHNDAYGGVAEDARADVTYAYTAVLQTFELGDIPPDAAHFYRFRVLDRVSPYGCVQAYDLYEASHVVCAQSDGVGLG